MHFEGLAGAVNVSIVAFSIVFGVLLVLTGVIYGMKLFAGSGDEKKNDVAPSKPAAPSAPKPAPVKAQVQADKAKIVAAITAAIVEFTGSSNFTVVSVQPEAGGMIPGNMIPMDYWTARWKTAGMIGLNSNGLVRKWH
ncbi:MAG: OadG family protein [Synergistaceae bacterium]|nr:OadG family protein [Synergistaceae bacterium]MBQ6113597.1 OadG family protein [Synergistaceae bacterium]MBQ6920001.1 OadG family protein [Synergistaceae bacterium]MBQ6969337.1 OadG family protein [Synergistaceae bacterium]MBQ7267910.1 OadG family protein [Synergistaceae bacterium]